MTIEEKAEEYRSDIFGTPFGKDIEMAFIEGAEWMIAKATAWLAKQGSKDNDGVVMICVEDFVKALEE